MYFQILRIYNFIVVLTVRQYLKRFAGLWIFLFIIIIIINWKRNDLSDTITRTFARALNKKSTDNGAHLVLTV